MSSTLLPTPKGPYYLLVLQGAVWDAPFSVITKPDKISVFLVGLDDFFLFRFILSCSEGLFS